MTEQSRKILVCSCERTIPLDADAVQRACQGATVVTANELCRGEAETFRAAAADDAPLLVGCTQEAPLFSELAQASSAEIAFANIRETAGWSKDARAAGPKIAALLASAAEPVPEIPF